VRTDHSAVEKAVPEGFFAYMAANPNVARVFDEAMTAASHAQIPAGATTSRGSMEIDPLPDGGEPV
jgi:hypothetical protein